MRFLPVAAFLLILAPGLAAQGNAEAEIAPKLDSLQQSMDRVSAALDELIRHRRADLLLRRMELAQRKIEPRETELLKAQSMLRTERSEVDRLTMMLDEIRSQTLSGLDISNEERDMQSEIERALERKKLRVVDQQRLVDELEQSVESERKSIRELERRLDDLMETLNL
ncbi:hypothetical protein ABI59_11395 [Acidobacteria bacterium Mor1]|nr:hypothetical protein ABI59_11395 [Acidobacteria bacterium Mor1]